MIETRIKEVKAGDKITYHVYKKVFGIWFRSDGIYSGYSTISGAMERRKEIMDKWKEDNIISKRWVDDKEVIAEEL